MIVVGLEALEVLGVLPRVSAIAGAARVEIAMRPLSPPCSAAHRRDEHDALVASRFSVDDEDLHAGRSAST